MEKRTMKEMNEELRLFAEKHGSFTVYTSPLVDNCYHKEYVFDDGAVWYEVNDTIKEEITAMAWGVRCSAIVTLARCEYWNTDDSSSKYVLWQVK